MRTKLENIIFSRLNSRMKLKINKIFIKKLKSKNQKSKGQELKLKY